MGGILLQCTNIPNHHNKHFKYLAILFVNDTSNKKAIIQGRVQLKETFSTHCLSSFSRGRNRGPEIYLFSVNSGQRESCQEH